MLSPQEQKHDDRRLDVSEIDADAVGGADLPGRELVADEQIVDDPLHLAGVEQNGAAPPGLEREEPLRLGVDVGIDVVVLGPEGVGGIGDSKLAIEARPVEFAGAEVAGKRRQPCAAEHAAEIAHRVLAANACPVGQRRSRHHDRAHQVRRDRRRHHGLPACLAIGDDDRLALGLGMATGDLFDESRLGAADVLDRLARHRLGREADEVAGWPARSATPISLSGFMPPIPGPWPARGSTTTTGGFAGSIAAPSGGTMRDEPIVDRPLQRPAVEDEFVREVQDIRDLLRRLRELDVSPLVERLEKQHAPLPRVRPVLRERAEEIRVLGHQPSSRAGLSSETPRSFAVSRPGPA